jgi:hypothetical protein
VDCADHPTICVVDEALPWFVVGCQDLHVSEGAGEVAVVVDALQTETAGPLAVWLLHDPNPRRGVYQMSGLHLLTPAGSCRGSLRSPTDATPAGERRPLAGVVAPVHGHVIGR